MARICDNFTDGFQQDCEKLRWEREVSADDSADRKKKETKLFHLLSELIETERKYVADLEQVRTVIVLSFSHYFHSRFVLTIHLSLEKIIIAAAWAEKS